MRKRGWVFDTQKYLQVQKRAVEERLAKFPGRLYLEFGGKLLEDNHAARTLPGYEVDAKLKLLKSLGRKLGVIYCISAKQLSEGKIRGDWGVGYDVATIRALEDLKKFGLIVEGVAINRYEGEKEADIFERRLKQMKIKVFKRKEIEGYPKNLELILSEKGYGADEYLKPKSKLVVVWGAGPGSGKLSTCLGQVYHEVKTGMNSGYAKFETFPVWDLPIDHPVNIAYEASTADMGDYNLVDSFHKKEYGVEAINYNRDVESFPIIRKIFEKMLKKDNFTRSYQSPTDMGINRLAEGIVDDMGAREAAKKEINFYLFRYRQEYKMGLVGKMTLRRMSKLLNRVEIEEDYLMTVAIARKARDEVRERGGKGKVRVFCGAAIELGDGQVVTGKNSSLLHAEAAVVLNSVKVLAGIDDGFDLISASVIRQINKLNKKLGDVSCSLDCAEMMMAWAISARDNPLAKKALNYLPKLRACFIHTTHRPSVADRRLFRKLGLWVSTDGEVA